MGKSNYRLWTPIANAFDAYRRRMLADPDAVYEHIWRLIHIHEAMVVCLGGLFVTRVLDLWKDKVDRLPELNDIRVRLTGIPVSSDESERSTAHEAALGGSIKAWIDVLQTLSSRDTTYDCVFCDALSTYLSEKREEPLAFLEAWKRIAPVPPAYTGSLPRTARFDAINALRNKLAHVPLPHKLVGDLHVGLRREILSMLSPKYDFKTDNGDFTTIDWHGPLHGKLLKQRFYITGSDLGKVSATGAGQNKSDGLIIETSINSTEKPTRWNGEPFVRIDEELKVSLLFRVPDLTSDPLAENFTAEYHRFAAEIEPVQKALIQRADLEAWIPVEAEPEPETQPVIFEDLTSTLKHAVTPQIESVDLDSPTVDLRDVAERAFRVRDYPLAVQAYDKLSKRKHASYTDVAKSKHGAALWRAAEKSRNNPEDVAEHREKMIKDAIGLLTAASRHLDPRYAARTLYEKSKAEWHLWRLNRDGAVLSEALVSATKASELDYDLAYISWLERITDEVETLKRPEPQPPR